MPTTGEKIKDLRRKRGMTQLQLADQVGVSAQVISNLERSYTSDRTKPEVLAAIAETLSTSVDYLIGSRTSDQTLFTNEEKELLQTFRKLKPYQQVLILTLLKDLTPQDQEGE